MSVGDIYVNTYVNSKLSKLQYCDKEMEHKAVKKNGTL